MFINMPALTKQLGIAKSKLSDKRIKGVIQDEVIKAYHAAIEETPQYSGYLASNLRIEVNGIHGGVATELRDAHENWIQLGAEYGKIKSKGDEYAIGIASVYNRWFNNFENDATFSMGDTVTIKYVEAPHWRTAEAGVKLRDVNAPGKALARAEASIKKNQRGWLFGSRSGVKI